MNAAREEWSLCSGVIRRSERCARAALSFYRMNALRAQRSFLESENERSRLRSVHFAENERSSGRAFTLVSRSERSPGRAFILRKMNAAQGERSF